jgi:hypothetical protein
VVKSLQPKAKGRVLALNATPTYVRIPMIEMHFAPPDVEQAKEELRESIEAGREIVRRSHVLIELCESEVPISAANDNPVG